jgi:hypothetical protein
MPCGIFAKPLNKGIFSVFGRFIEDYLRKFGKFKNRFGRSATKLSKNCRQKTKSCWVVMKLAVGVRLTKNVVFFVDPVKRKPKLTF